MACIITSCPNGSSCLCGTGVIFWSGPRCIPISMARRGIRLKRPLSKGNDVLFDIDWQGTLQMKKAARKDIVTVFVLPPSMAELKNRLIRRAEDSEDVIERRLHNARIEISHWDEYDYVIVNDDLEKAFAAVSAILEAERHKRERVIGARSFVEGMLTN